MKVLLVGAYPPPFGGLQVHLVHLERFLEERDHRCFVINLGKNKSLKSPKIVSPKFSYQVAYHLLKRRSYLCHLHFGGVLHARLLLLALVSNLIFYKRCAITVHSGGLSAWELPKGKLKKLFLKSCFGLCRAVICVNSGIAQYFKRVGIKSDRIHIVSPFAFENKLNGGPLPEPIKLFMNNKKPLLCSIGLLEPEYDLDLLLRVFRRFAEVKERAGLVIIGSGSLQLKLENMISQLGLEGKALLIGDLDHDTTLKILASSNCYIRVSRYDGDCISLKEAIHLGVPAIATDTGMRPEEAILVRIGDENDLFDRLVDTVSGPSGLRKGGKANEISSIAEVEKILTELTNTF